MRLPDGLLSRLLSFLLGSAWAMVFIGAGKGLFHGIYGGNLLASVLNMVVWMLPGLFVVVLVEYLFAGFENKIEMKKQNELLEEIVKKLDNLQRNS